MLITLGSYVLERTINIHNCGENQTVTLKLNSTVYATATSDSSGNVSIKVYDDGTYTASTTARPLEKSVIVTSDVETYSLDMMGATFYYYGLNPDNIFVNTVANVYGTFTVIPEYADGAGDVRYYYNNNEMRYSGADWCRAVCASTSPIDVTNYNKLKIEGRVTYGSPWGGSGAKMGLCLSRNPSTDNSDIIGTDGTGKGTVDEIDISDKSGNYYFVAQSYYYHGYQAQGGCSLNLYKAYLE